MLKESALAVQGSSKLPRNEPDSRVTELNGIKDAGRGHSGDAAMPQTLAAASTVLVSAP